MEVVNNNQKSQSAPVNNEQKLQYENNQLKSMLNNMRQQMEQMNMVNVFKRLDFLFKVIQYKDAFSSDFVIACIEEIEERMTLVENNNEEKVSPDSEKEAE